MVLILILNMFGTPAPEVQDKFFGVMSEQARMKRLISKISSWLHRHICQVPPGVPGFDIAAFGPKRNSPVGCEYGL